MASAQSGIARLEIDGEWDIADLADLSDSLSESYGLLYPLVAVDDEVRAKLHDAIRKQFWSGDMDTRNFGRFLYRNIPKEDGLKLKSFSYASPGALEIGGVLACFLMLSKVARCVIAAASEFIELWKKVDKFFDDRKHLKRPSRKLAVDDDLALHSDEALSLCRLVGAQLGFDDISNDRIVEIAGNPIAALKFLVTVGNEGSKLARLQREGLLKLPPQGESAQVSPTGRPGRRIGSRGVSVESKKDRGKKPKAP